jgi:serine protease AprX
VRANSLGFAIPIILGIGLSVGSPPLLAEPAAGQEEPASPDPTWQRLGLPESPTPESGRGVGVVQLDDGGLHPALRPLGERLKHVIVGQDMSVSLAEPLEAYTDRDDAEYTHGVRGLLQMASAPFRVRDRTYGGLAPGATYFVIPYLTVREDGPDGRHHRYDTRLDRAIEWVVQNRERWNIRILLLTVGVEFPPPPPEDPDIPKRCGLIKNTREYRIVRALEPAIRAGILVVTGNHNTATVNILPPVEYLSVGAYHDAGHADPRFHRENPDEPWGRNSDGHERPDVLAPKYFVPNHRTPEGELAHFGGTSSASAQVAALCALLFARFPQADAQTIKYALIHSGDPLPGSRRPGVRVNAARAIQLLTDGSVRPPWPRIPPPVTVTDPNSSLRSKDAVERALAVSALAWHPELFRPKDGERLRQVFWRLLRDDSPTVRKAAASALAGPESEDERRRLWGTLHRESDMGVRGLLAEVLLAGARADPLDDWIPLATDPNWSARWCAVEVLRDHYPAAPRLDYAVFPEEIEKKAQPVLDWYRKRKQSR